MHKNNIEGQRKSVGWKDTRIKVKMSTTRQRERERGSILVLY